MSKAALTLPGLWMHSLPIHPDPSSLLPVTFTPAASCPSMLQSICQSTPVSCSLWTWQADPWATLPDTPAYLGFGEIKRMQVSLSW